MNTNRTKRDFEARDPEERQWMLDNTWCDTCEAADLGMTEPTEYEESGRTFIEGKCKGCGTIIRNELSEKEFQE